MEDTDLEGNHEGPPRSPLPTSLPQETQAGVHVSLTLTAFLPRAKFPVSSSCISIKDHKLGYFKLKLFNY